MQLDELISKGSVVVAAPHPDDETLGCGGLIAGLTQRGVVVHTVFVTDGGGSHTNSPTWARGRLSAIRRVEAENALAGLGAGGQPRTFLNLRDADMPTPGSDAYNQALETVCSILVTHQPSSVVLPWRRDPHRDHRDTYFLFANATRKTGLNPQVLEYAIWLDELGAPEDFPKPREMDRLELSITQWLHSKRMALFEHKSQMGQLIDDDPEGFCLTEETIARLVSDKEVYWRQCKE